MSPLSTASLSAWLSASAHAPLAQALIILLGTFILEDGATILTAIAVGSGTVPLQVGLPALYAGIVTGDAGLYGLGRLAARWPAARRWAPSSTGADKRGGPSTGKWWHGAALFRVIFFCRFIPGTRLPVYTASGFFAAGFRVFLLATIAATLIWTTALFALSLRLGQVLLDTLGAWRWAGIAGFMLAMMVVGRHVSRAAAPR